MKTAFLAASLALCACDPARIAGGMAVSSAAEPAGAVTGVWTPHDCRDARGAPFASSVGVVKLVRRPDGRFVVVETRPAFDSLVVTNSFISGQERVFQLALKSSSSAPYLREYRLPAGGSGEGRFVLVAKGWNSRDTDDGFVAWYGAAAVSCELHLRPPV